MIRRIVEHNRLNGVIFSTLEFIVVAAAAAFIGFGMAAQRRPIVSPLAVGTALNCLVIVGFGAMTWYRGERGHSPRTVFSVKGRAEISREHPDLMADTLVVAAAALIPYVLLVAVSVELLRATKS